MVALSFVGGGSQSYFESVEFKPPASFSGCHVNGQYDFRVIFCVTHLYGSEALVNPSWDAGTPPFNRYVSTAATK